MALIYQFPTPGAPLKDWLAGFIYRFPFDDIANEFQRGMLSGLMEAYEAAGFDLGDARYIAGLRLLEKMATACR